MKHLRNTFAFFCTSILLSFLITPALSQVPAIDSNHASTQLDKRQEHIHGGSEIAFKIKLDEPLPVGAHFDVRLSPLSINQQLSVSSGEPLNRERTEFLLHVTLPNEAFPGPWHIAQIWLFLPGASWSSNQVSTNDLSFNVEGPKVDLPTKGTATLISESR